jgi:hypothetical protein
MEKFLVLTDIDIWMCDFAFSANKLYQNKKINSNQKTQIEKLLNLYRKYLQNGQKNKNEMRRSIALFISKHRYGDIEKTTRSGLSAQKRIAVRFAMKNREKIRIKRGEIDEKNTRLTPEQIQEIQVEKVKSQLRMEQMMKEQMYILAENKERKSFDAGLNVEASLASKKDIRAMTQMLEKQEVNKEPFWNLHPSLWGQKIYRGFKEQCVNLAFAPITVPKYLFTNVIMANAYEGFKKITGPLWFLFQLYMLFIVVGKTLHIVYVPQPFVVGTKHVWNVAIPTVTPYKPTPRCAVDSFFTAPGIPRGCLKDVGLSMALNLKLRAGQAMRSIILGGTEIVVQGGIDPRPALEGYKMAGEDFRDLVYSAEAYEYYNQGSYKTAKTIYDGCMNNSGIFGRVVCGTAPTYEPTLYEKYNINLKEYERKKKAWDECKVKWIRIGCEEITEKDRPEKPADRKKINKKRIANLRNWVVDCWKWWKGEHNTNDGGPPKSKRIGFTDLW